MGRVRSAAIIIEDQKLLVISRNNRGNHNFVFPGGGVESDETPEQTVIREVSEEASLEIELGRLAYKINYDNETKQYFFVCKYVGGEPAISPSSPEAANNAAGDDLYEPIWLPLAQLSQTLLYPLEVRDWLLEDLKNGFSKAPKEFDLKFNERRRAL